MVGIAGNGKLRLDEWLVLMNGWYRENYVQMNDLVGNAGIGKTTFRCMVGIAGIG